MSPGLFYMDRGTISPIILSLINRQFGFPSPEKYVLVWWHPHVAYILRGTTNCDN